MSALTNYFTDTGMNCHILCVLSGLEETLPVRLLAACSFIQCILFILIIFSFPVFVFGTSFLPLLFKQFLLRLSSSIIKSLS